MMEKVLSLDGRKSVLLPIDRTHYQRSWHHNLDSSLSLIASPFAPEFCCHVLSRAAAVSQDQCRAHKYRPERLMLNVGRRPFKALWVVVCHFWRICAAARAGGRRRSGG